MRYSAFYCKWQPAASLPASSTCMGEISKLNSEKCYQDIKTVRISCLYLQGRLHKQYSYRLLWGKSASRQFSTHTITEKKPPEIKVKFNDKTPKLYTHRNKNTWTKHNWYTWKDFPSKVKISLDSKTNKIVPEEVWILMQSQTSEQI